MGAPHLLMKSNSHVYRMKIHTSTGIAQERNKPFPAKKQQAMVLKDHHCQRATFLLIFFALLLCNQANAVHGDRFSLASQFLAPHNAVRSALRIPSLVWDPRVARYARWYANKRRQDCALKHSNGPYGENIFWGSGTGWTPARAVTAWAGERKWYKYWSNDCALGRECGHYTQMIWRTTRRLGCAKVTCSGGKGVFMVCNYDPPGNYIGERPY